MKRLIVLLALLGLFPTSLALAIDGPPNRSTLDYNVHISDCENRWVAMYHKPGDDDYTYAFVYIDPEAGFTLHYGGTFIIDAEGEFRAKRKIPQFDDGKAMLKVRVAGNGLVAVLPPAALTQLGLTDKPDWLSFYEDKDDPITHKVSWGFHYNAVGDAKRALEFLEAAYKERQDAPGLVVELAFAYNALGRPDEALRVTKKEFDKHPKDEKICREMAFASLTLKNYKEAVAQYQTCIALCGDSESDIAEKSELAANLSSAYEALGDRINRDMWLAKAKNWAPKGSQIYKLLYPDAE